MQIEVKYDLQTRHILYRSQTNDNRNQLEVNN